MRKFTYDPTLHSFEEIKELFVFRHDVLTRIVAQLKANLGNRSNISVLVTGTRGTGKSTLLMRVMSEIENDKVLNAGWCPIWLHDDDIIKTAADMWNTAVQVAEGSPVRPLAPETQGDTSVRKRDLLMHQKALSALLELAGKRKKRILLILENFDNVLCRQMSATNAHAVMKALAEHPEVAVLVSAIRPSSLVRRGGKELLKSFQEFRLGRLAKEDWAKLGKALADNHLPATRVRSLQVLTGGNLRLLTILSHYRWLGMGWEDTILHLKTISDIHSDFLEEHTRTLEMNERKVYKAIARRWDPSACEQISLDTGLQPQVVAGTLSNLTALGIVDSFPSRRDGTTLYHATEQFYTVHLLMKEGRSDAGRAQAAVHFMVTFYDNRENIQLGNTFVKYALGRKGSDRDLALVACKTLVQRLDDYTPEQALRLITETTKRDLERAQLRALVVDATGVFGEAAQYGALDQVITMIDDSPTARLLLTPLHQALLMRAGQIVDVSPAIMEVAHDIERLIRRDEPHPNHE